MQKIKLLSIHTTINLIRVTVQILKDYLYSYTKSKHKQVEFIAYDPRIEPVINGLIKDLNKAVPDLNINHFGSSSLKILGRGDIDIFIACKSHDFNVYLPPIITVIGKPNKSRGQFIQWNFLRQGFPVDLCLIDPECMLYQNQIMLHKALKNDQTLLSLYAKQKEDLNGVSFREYSRKRMKFFNQIILKNIFINIHQNKPDSPLI